MDHPLPESNTTPSKQSRVNTRARLEAFAWVRTGVNALLWWHGSEHGTAASTIMAIIKAAVHYLLHEN